MFKFLKGFIVLCLLLVSFTSYGYFEWKYFCSVHENSIEVSISTGDQKCFQYFNQLSSTMIEIEDDISTADGYIQAERDISYRMKIKKDLLMRYNELDGLRDHFVTAIDDYEFDLYFKIKSLVGSYLRPRREFVSQKIQKAHRLLDRLKLIGDSKNFVFVVQKKDLLEQELILLDRIKFSHSFSELIPALKAYIKSGKIELKPEKINKNGK